MVQGDLFEDGPRRRLGGISGALRARETWRVASRYVLLVVSTLITLSVLAAAIPTLMGMDSFIIDGGSMRPAVPSGALVVANRVDPAAVLCRGRSSPSVTPPRPARPSPTAW